MLLGLLVVLHVAGQIRAPDLPDQAPEFRLRTLDGVVVSSAELQGKKVILNFWATWCMPCKLEMPVFRRFAAANPDVVVLGVTADGSRSEIAQSVDALEITWPVTYPNPAVKAAYDVSVFPTTVVIGPDGGIKAAHAGILTDPQLYWLTR